jgi:hypothetical protein
MYTLFIIIVTNPGGLMLQNYPVGRVEVSLHACIHAPELHNVMFPQMGGRV